jgi:hypothetical protein
MAQYSDPCSDYFLLQGADDYSPETRLVDTLSTAEASSPAMMAYRRAYAYDIKRKRISMFNDDTDFYRMFLSIKTKYARQIKTSTILTGVDHYLHEETKKIRGGELWKAPIDSLNKKLGFFTDGYNTLSQTRYRYYDNPKYKFHPTKTLILDLCSEEIVLRLDKLSEVL